jgi:cobalamin biosynthesis Co2+ chelatase CbiK
MVDTVDDIVDSIKRYEPSFDHLSFLKSYLAYKTEVADLRGKYDRLMEMMREHGASVTVKENVITIHTKDGVGKEEISSYLHSIDTNHDIRGNDIVITNTESFMRFLSVIV